MNTRKQIPIRIPTEIHDRLKEKAERDGRSINGYIVSLLNRDLDGTEHDDKMQTASSTSDAVNPPRVFSTPDEARPHYVLPHGSIVISRANAEALRNLPDAEGIRMMRARNDFVRGLDIGDAFPGILDYMTCLDDLDEDTRKFYQATDENGVYGNANFVPISTDLIEGIKEADAQDVKDALIWASVYADTGEKHKVEKGKATAADLLYIFMTQAVDWLEDQGIGGHRNE